MCRAKCVMETDVLKRGFDVSYVAKYIKTLTQEILDH